MRILHTADLHSQWRWYDWISNQADRFDLVVLAGDLVDMLDDTTLPSQIQRVSDWVRTFPGRLAVCSGNHDVFLEQSENPDLRHPQWIQRLRSERVIVDGDSVQVDSLRIEVVAWNAVPLLVEDTALVIAHCPPAGVSTAFTADDPLGLGDHELLESIQASRHAPWLVLGGHNHSPRRWYGRIPRQGGTTWSLVPGCRMKFDVPFHIIIDTEKRRAERVRPSLTEVISLSR